MTVITYAGTTYASTEDQTVLETLLTAGASVPHSCRSGLCQSCALQVVKGQVPAGSQVGLKASLTANGVFLSCIAKPTEDLEVALPGELLGEVEATLVGKKWLNDTVLQVWLRPHSNFDVQPGQFLNLLRSDGLARSYSIANRPRGTQSGDASLIELHVAVLPQGRMSQWLAEEAKPGLALKLRGPSGECTYSSKFPDETLLLAGTGTGLAPLLGIARQALASAHRGRLVLMHAAQNKAGLYLQEELNQLAQEAENFTYLPIVLTGDAEKGLIVGSLLDRVLAANWDFATLRTYLCGAPDLVNKLRKKSIYCGRGSKPHPCRCLCAGSGTEKKLTQIGRTTAQR